MEETVKAYAAGVIDGEGCIYFATGKAPGGGLKYQAFIAVGTADTVLPQWMHSNFEGSCAESKSPSVLARGNRPVWKWQLSGRRNIVAFLEMVLPYLKLKADQALLMIEFCHLRDDGMACPVGKRGYTEREHEIVRLMRKKHYTSKSWRGSQR